jgi:hypothetical protein
MVRQPDATGLPLGKFCSPSYNSYLWRQLGLTPIKKALKHIGLRTAPCFLVLNFRGHRSPYLVAMNPDRWAGFLTSGSSYYLRLPILV